MTRASGETQVLDFVREARDSKRAFEIVGGGTRRAAGNPMGDLPVLDVSGLSGIVKYQPEELILTARPGTGLAEVKRVLAEKNQCLGFDPVKWDFLGASGQATIGGAVSSDASGSGRLRHGAARDSLLGFRGINGLGEAFSAGGKVVKNVTGFDLPKLLTGSHGTLAALTEITIKVLPAPEAIRVTEAFAHSLGAAWIIAIICCGAALAIGWVTTSDRARARAEDVFTTLGGA
jgi:glycolate oxidase FAD binding subunit